MSAEDRRQAGRVPGACRRQVDHGAGPVLPEDVQVDVAHERLAAAAAAPPTLAPWIAVCPADQGADLGVAQLGLRRHLREQGVLRVADELVVDVARAPPVAVREQRAAAPRPRTR